LIGLPAGGLAWYLATRRARPRLVASAGRWGDQAGEAAPVRYRPERDPGLAQPVEIEGGA